MQIQEDSARRCKFLPSRAEPARPVARQQRRATPPKCEDVNRRRAFTNTLKKLRALSCQLDPDMELQGRIKSIASISNKMLVNGLGLHQVLDIIGLRVVTQHTRDCYWLVDRIHSQFVVLESEYDDYITIPKPNGYRSLHTIVVSPCGLPVEIQIRTHWMHNICERGSAAHSQYKKDHVAWMPLSRGSPVFGGVT